MQYFRFKISIEFSLSSMMKNCRYSYTLVLRIVDVASYPFLVFFEAQAGRTFFVEETFMTASWIVFISPAFSE